MARIKVAARFVDDLCKVEYESKQEEILNNIELLETVPEIGSRILADSIVELFGDDVRKVPVNPFDVIYRYSKEEDTVFVVGLLHQREVW